MYGWRGKLGLLVPANNTVIEPELNRLLPEGTSLFSTRMMVEGPFSPEALNKMENEASRGIRELEVSEVDFIVYSCMSTSLVKGKDWDLAFESIPTNRMTRKSTAAKCTVEALLSRLVKKVAILSPYPEAIQSLVIPYFKMWGLQPVSTKSLDIGDYHTVTRINPETLYREVRGMKLRDAEGICILATDLRTLEINAILEKDLGLPVVSTNLAICWSFLKNRGIELPMQCLYSH